MPGPSRGSLAGVRRTRRLQTNQARTASRLRDLFKKPDEFPRCRLAQVPAKRTLDEVHGPHDVERLVFGDELHGFFEIEQGPIPGGARPRRPDLCDSSFVCSPWAWNPEVALGGEGAWGEGGSLFAGDVVRH